ncbi:hypothetical protein MES4922_190216 [Mesorhizobium ventifaucium]|uniref:Uncharacterized protein n=1 Tax=Mesorhizobium ventifaucium TaxID=666020 RepID=A0ABM9DMX0_9HYPH|nr:hypothetical protein MES4922_190216 [Mesorhizobium ventifaucium]
MIDAAYLKKLNRLDAGLKMALLNLS